jgi:hypothetical protein
VLHVSREITKQFINFDSISSKNKSPCDRRTVLEKREAIAASNISPRVVTSPDSRLSVIAIVILMHPGKTVNSLNRSFATEETRKSISLPDHDGLFISFDDDSTAVGTGKESLNRIVSLRVMGGQSFARVPAGHNGFAVAMRRR